MMSDQLFLRFFNFCSLLRDLIVDDRFVRKSLSIDVTSESHSLTTDLALFNRGFFAEVKNTTETFFVRLPWL